MEVIDIHSLKSGSVVYLKQHIKTRSSRRSSSGGASASSNTEEKVSRRDDRQAVRSI